MFSRYYQSELTYLRELGREFAQANPALVKGFSDRDADPEIERLLEGFAFLAARIRERVDDALPEVIDALGQLIVPQLFRQLPACSIVQFTPNATAIRGHLRVEAGAKLASRSIEGTRCLFRTVAPVDLFPMRLEGCGLDPSTESEPRIRLRFRVPGEVKWPSHGKLRLFLNGPLGLSSCVYLWLSSHLQRVGLEAKGETHTLSPRVTFPGIRDEMNLLPWPDTVPDGLRLLQEYFTLPSKMMFVDLGGFDRLPPDAFSGSFDLVLHFKAPPKLPERLTSDLFQLHCTPVVNLFEIDGSPVKHDSSSYEHLMRGLDTNPLHLEVYSVDSVTALEETGTERKTYAPFFSFAHLSQARSGQGYYQLRRARSPIDSALDTYVSVLTPADVEPDFTPRVLSFELTCTNRKLPNELRPGDICEPTSSSPTVAQFRNITRVTRPTRPPVGTEKHWRLVSHAALNVRALADPNVLASLLAHYNVHEETDQQLYEANRLRIDAIRDVQTSRERRVFERIPMFGLHTKVELDETGFAGIGDAYLFGSALQRLLVSESPINCFHRLSVTLYPSNKVLTWRPETGTQETL